VNWSSFANLNREQAKLIEEAQRPITETLAHAGILRLTQVASLSPEEFLEIVWPVLEVQTTQRKALNLSKKVVDGSSWVVDVLRRHGVRL
jgi:hypothetical protein